MCVPTDSRPDWLKNNAAEMGVLAYDDRVVPYTIAAASLEPRLPGFVGYPNGQDLFISEEVPVEYRRYMLWHEIRCHELGIGHCEQALREELARVPEADRPAYVTYRRDFFVRLVDYYSSAEFELSANDPFMLGLISSRDYLLSL